MPPISPLHDILKNQSQIMSRFRILKLLLAVLLALPSMSTAQSRIDKNVVIGTHSGLALLMDVHYPENPNGYGIVHIAGSAWRRELAYNAPLLSQSLQVELFGRPLVEQGYTVFSLNHRAIPRFQFPSPLDDVERAVRFIRFYAATFKINPDRIGAVGGSSGGHLVSLLGVLDGDGNPNDPDPVNRMSSKVQTVVARAPSIDLARTSDNVYIGLLVGATSPPNDPNSEESQLYRAASPINFVSSDDPPFLLLHGDKDDVVPFEQSELMRDALTAEGVATHLFVIPGGGHGATFRGAQPPPDYIGTMINWFDQHLRNK